MADPYAQDDRPVSTAGKHDRHACPVYKKTISPCKDCLPANHDVTDPPTPMCADPAPAPARHTGRPTRRTLKKDVDISHGVPESLKFGDELERAFIIEKIVSERIRHRAMGFTVQHTNDQFCRIMAEELGEVAKAMQEAEVTGKDEHLEEEAIQLASAAVALVESIRVRRKYKMLTAVLPEGA
jgi:NTP pyrophosphatase (non-canonical NTP hydrolase)